MIHGQLSICGLHFHGLFPDSEKEFQEAVKFCRIISSTYSLPMSRCILRASTNICADCSTSGKGRFLRFKSLYFSTIYSRATGGGGGAIATGGDSSAAEALAWP